MTNNYFIRYFLAELCHVLMRHSVTITASQELGSQFANTYAAALLGNQVRFYSGDLVVAALRFTTHEYQQQHYQDVQVTEVRKVE